MGSPAGSLDTSAEVAGHLLEGWRRMGPTQRAALVDRWSRDVRELAAVGIRRRLPSATPTEIRIELGRLLYGDAVVTDEVAAAVHAHDGGATARP